MLLLLFVFPFFRSVKELEMGGGSKEEKLSVLSFVLALTVASLAALGRGFCLLFLLLFFKFRAFFCR